MSAERDFTVGRVRSELYRAVRHGNMTKAQADELNLIVSEYLASHWRDDDSPQSETTFGVCAALARVATICVALLIVTLLAATGCASTTIRIPIRLPDGEIVMAEYHSDRDSTIEHMHLEMRPDGTFIAELQGASGQASPVVQAYGALGAAYADKIAELAGTAARKAVGP